MRSAVYTAIFGDYDNLQQPVPQDADCDFICFTDQDLPARVGLWNVVRVRRSFAHPRMQAKYFKVLSHKVFPGGRLSWRNRLRRGGWSLGQHIYTHSIWIDGRLIIKSPSFARDLAPPAAETGWAMFSHPDRDNIFDEAEVCATMVKCQGLPVIEQVESYRHAGFNGGGLRACTVIARAEPEKDRLREANAVWWREINAWTYRDQLSLPYVLWKTRTPIGVIPGNLWQNQWFDWAEHLSDL